MNFVKSSYKTIIPTETKIIHVNHSSNQTLIDSDVSVDVGDPNFLTRLDLWLWHTYAMILRNQFLWFSDPLSAPITWIEVFLHLPCLGSSEALRPVEWIEAKLRALSFFASLNLKMIHFKWIDFIFQTYAWNIGSISPLFTESWRLRIRRSGAFDCFNLFLIHFKNPILIGIIFFWYFAAFKGSPNLSHFIF